MRIGVCTVAIVLVLGLSAGGSSARDGRTSGAGLAASPRQAPGTARGTTRRATSAVTAHAPSSPAVGRAAGSGPVPHGFLAASLSFVSPSDGWVLGTAPCSRAPCTSLVHTTDGGASWAGVPAPRAPLGSATNSTSVSGLRFVDAREGFAYGPGLWVTADGARTWRRLRSVAGIRPLYVLALTPAADRSVYALVARGTQRSGPTGAPTLVRAAPGSLTFTPLARFSANAVGSLTLVSAGAEAYVAEAGRLVRVAGGQVTSSALPTRDPCALASSGSDALLAVCGSGVGGGSMGDRSAFGTVNGGRSWVRLTDPGRGDGFDGEGVGETANGHAVIGTSDAAGSGLLATFDGGRRWHLVLSYRDEGDGFADLGFENDSDGSVIYGPALAGARMRPRPPGELLRTSDGGHSWHRVPIR